MSDLLRLELEAVVVAMWVLGTELASFTTAVNALKLWTIFTVLDR